MEKTIKRKGKIALITALIIVSAIALAMLLYFADYYKKDEGSISAFMPEIEYKE